MDQNKPTSRNRINSPQVIAVLAGVILLAAIVLGLTKFKLQPAKNNSQSSLTNTAMTYTAPGTLPASEIHNKQARIVTPKGTIIFSLNDAQAPLTVSSFVFLAQKHFFDGLTWHRVVPGFVIQGGDPTGTGSGGPGYQFPDEPVTGSYTTGTVAMANAGPNTNGSQFFIVVDDQPTLPKLYTIFGTVTSGIDVVHAILQGDTMTSVTIEDLGTAK